MRTKCRSSKRSSKGKKTENQKRTTNHQLQCDHETVELTGKHKRREATAKSISSFSQKLLSATRERKHKQTLLPIRTSQKRRRLELRRKQNHTQVVIDNNTQSATHTRDEVFSAKNNSICIQANSI
jgi:hypothetical protein